MEKINDDFSYKFGFDNSNIPSEFVKNLKKINPYITEKDIKSDFKRLYELSSKELENVSGGKMDYKTIKNLAISAILTASVINVSPNTQAMYGVRESVNDGSVVSDSINIFDIFEKENREKDKIEKENMGILMEPRYFKEDYNQQYEVHDLNRIVKGTFDASKYFRNKFLLEGPWRVSAFKMAKKDSEFKVFINSLKILPYEKKNFAYLCSHKTQNAEFEKLAEEYRLKWNEEFNPEYSKIKSYEDAFERALIILKKITHKEDPFDRRRVEALYDKDNKIYIVKRTYDTRPFMRSNSSISSVVFNENGEVFSVVGAFRQ